MKMNMFDILEALCDRVHEKFPGRDIYIGQVPQGFSRPSFYVSIIGFSDHDAWNGAMKRTSPFQVVYFAEKDARGIVDMLDQYAGYATLAELFQGHGFAVKDRNLKITSLTGGPRDAEVYLTIDFEYWFSPESSLSPEEAAETMQELQMKYLNNN